MGQLLSAGLAYAPWHHPFDQPTPGAMHRILSLALLAAALTFSACDVIWNHGDGDDPVLLPLDDGNRWIMEFTRTDAEGTLIETFTDTLSVVGDTTVSGEHWAEVRCSQDSNSCIPGGFYTNRDDGVWKWDDPSSDEAPYLLYKYPATIGDTYDLPGSANFSVTVLGTDAPVETPAGTLLAYHYELDTDEAYGHPVSEGAGRLDRYLVPDQGFAFIGCSFLAPNDEGELVIAQEFDWQLIAFETP